MPKKPEKLFLRAYSENEKFFAELPLLASSREKVYDIFLEYAKLLASGEFTHVNRIDLVSAGRVLFSVLLLYRNIDQKNLTINFNPY